MSEMAAPVLDRASTIGEAGGEFNVFLSLRDGASSEDFSSGIDDIGEEATAGVDEAAGKFDLVAVASGEKKLPPTEEVSASIGQTACVTCVGCPFLSQCVKPQALAVKQESERQDNVSDDMNSADEEVVPNLMEMTPKESYLERLLAPDDLDSLDENGRGELVMAGYSGSTDYQEPIIKKAPEPVVAEAKPIDLTTKTDESTEKIIPQEREDKTSTNQAVEASGEDVDTEAAETPFSELKTAPEIAADDTTDAGEALSESTSEISGEGHFTETAEASSPSIEVKPHVIDDISDAAHNNKPTPESFDTPAQAETAPVSLAINEDTQTGDENSNPLENETVYPMANEDKVTASVVENTYNDDKTTAPSSVKTPSIERQKENNFVIAGSKSANSEPSRAAENDESATPVSEQQHLAVHFDTVKVDESVTTGPIDNSGTKASTDTQPSELNMDAALDYDNFVESTDGVNTEQPKHVIPAAVNVPLSQEQEDAINVSAEYEKNETSTKEMVNASAPIPAKDQPDQPAIMLSSIEDGVEYGESSLSVSEESPDYHDPTRPDVVNKPTTHEVMEVTHEAGEMIELEAMKVTPPADAIAVSGGKNQIDLSPELNEELVVDKRVHETQTSLVEQLYHDDATVECSHGKDNEFWAEEDMVFFVEQQSPAVEPEVSSAEAVTIALPMEATTAREEVDDLKLFVGNDIDSVEQLDNSKAASVPEITNDDYELEEQIVTSTSPAVELTPDAELDEPVESELGEQNDLAVVSAVDNYGYNSETSTVSDNILVVKNHPSLGLWSDDSRLNPEEEAVATIQSGATDTSLASRLVGVLVVAICVARGRQASAIVSSR